MKLTKYSQFNKFLEISSLYFTKKFPSLAMITFHIKMTNISTFSRFKKLRITP